MASRGAGSEAGGFLHGVGSFDPLPNAVLLWTRLTPPGGPAAGAHGSSCSVGWEVSPLEDFCDIVASGTVSTNAGRDYTVAVDATGLRPNQRYFYRFHCGKLRSVTGMTKTAADGALEELLFATVSCSNWGFGHFHAYHLAARVDGLDFVLHAGDYVYEFGKGFYPDRRCQARHGLRPKHTCRSLEDYRSRYACYRTDPALQELHRRVPWIVVWDDGETADSSFRTGAEGSDGSRAEWEQRKRQAIQAYIEWLPVRGMSHERLDLAGCHRTFQFGDLATLMLVENRIAHRSPHVDLQQTDFFRQTALRDLSDWDDSAIRHAKADLLRQFVDPSREMIGEQQVRDVQRDTQASVAAGAPWQVFLSQTILCQIRAPKLLETVELQPQAMAWLCRKALGLATDEKRAGKESAQLARLYLAMGQYGVPMNQEAYDGYQAERQQLLAALNAAGGNPVVLAGDSHNAWAHELVDSRGCRLGVEFDAPAVTAVGAFEDIYARFKRKVGRLAGLLPLRLFTPWIEDALAAANPATLRYANLDQRGLLLHHVTRRTFHTEYHFVADVQRSAVRYKHYCGAVWEAEAGVKGRLEKGMRYITIDGKIPPSKSPKHSFLKPPQRYISRQEPAAW